LGKYPVRDLPKIWHTHFKFVIPKWTEQPYPHISNYRSEAVFCDSGVTKEPWRSPKSGHTLSLQNRP
jgi:hypothetical protein